MDGLLRGKRLSIDTGTGTKRVAGARKEHVGRGTFVNWQDDLGISSDTRTADGIRAGEKAFGAQVVERTGKIGEAKEAISSSEKAFKESIVPVTLWSGSKKQGTYMLPRESIPEFIKKDMASAWSSREQSENPFANVAEKVAVEGRDGSSSFRQVDYTPAYSKWATDKEDTAENYLYVRPKILESIGKYRDALESADRQVRAKEAEATAQHEALRGQVAGSEGILRGQVGQRQAEWDKIHSDYKKRQEIMKKILGGLDFG